MVPCFCSSSNLFRFNKNYLVLYVHLLGHLLKSSRTCWVYQKRSWWADEIPFQAFLRSQKGLFLRPTKVPKWSVTNLCWLQIFWSFIPQPSMRDPWVCVQLFYRGLVLVYLFTCQILAYLDVFPTYAISKLPKSHFSSPFSPLSKEKKTTQPYSVSRHQGFCETKTLVLLALRIAKCVCSFDSFDRGFAAVRGCFGNWRQV